MRRLWAILCGAAVLGGCNQDHIFFSITQEVDLVDPRINGTPTAAVTLGGTVYVASKFSGAIHTYTAGAWGVMAKQPGGKIIELAGTENFLFALTSSSGDPAGSVTLRKIEAGSIGSGDWETVSGAPANTQSLYGAGEYVFAGVMTRSGTFKDDAGIETTVEISGTPVAGFEIWGAKEDAAALTCLKEKTTFLTGAAFDGAATYYLGTNRPYSQGGGIYTFAAGGAAVSSAAEPGTKGLDIAGIIALPNTTAVMGVSRNGSLLYNGGGGGGFTLLPAGLTFTGALGVWESGGGAKKLLLLGIQGGSTSTTHGYRELALAADGSLDPNNTHLASPGASANSSVSNADKYESSLRRHPLVGITQAPDGILFAATLKNGLWAYRNDEWNAEE
ncbi:MAG: hypothetical protein LBD13_02045 [Spirochaetaceae bacterium]|jgi:hypothetical protein|nr:hypothetical protein [Spirochaetaceae bacterium]